MIVTFLLFRRKEKKKKFYVRQMVNGVSYRSINRYFELKIIHTFEKGKSIFTALKIQFVFKVRALEQIYAHPFWWMCFFDLFNGYREELKWMFSTRDILLFAANHNSRKSH